MSKIGSYFKRLTRGKKIAWGVAVFLLLLTAAGAIGYNYWYHKPRTSVSIDPTTGDLVVSEDTAPSLDGRINILLIGADQRDPKAKAYNTDSLILTSIDPETEQVSMLSIPRDTRVEIPKRGMAKINAAESYGGLNMTVAVVQQLTGVKINGYIKTNFEGFKNVIDAIGGITVNVEKDMYWETGDDEDGVINLKKGEQLLDGSKALQYARFRHDTYADITRTARQQVVLKAIAKKMMEPANLVKIPVLIPDFYKAVETNLPLSDLIDIAKVASKYDSAKIISQTLPGYFLNVDGISYWGVNQDDVKKVVEDLFKGVVTGNTPDKLIMGSKNETTKPEEPVDDKPQMTLGVIGFNGATASSINVMVTGSKGAAKAEVWRSISDQSKVTDPAKKGRFLAYPKNGQVWKGGAVSFTDSGLDPNTQYSYQLVVYDAKGIEQRSDSRSIKTKEAQPTDSTPPALTLEGPAQTNSNNATVSGKVEAGSSLTIKVNETAVSKNAVQIDSSGRFTASVSLSPGSNQVVAVATDEAGNSAEQKITIRYGPSLTINTSNPVANKVTVSGHTEAGNTVKIKVQTGNQIVLAETAVHVDANGNFSKEISLAPGENVITVTATNSAGVKTEKTTKVNYDALSQ